MSEQQNLSDVSIPIEVDQSLVLATAGHANAIPRQEQEQRIHDPNPGRQFRPFEKILWCCSCSSQVHSAWCDIMMGILLSVGLIIVMNFRNRLEDKALDIQLENSLLILLFFLMADLISSLALFSSIVEKQKDFAKWCLNAHLITFFLVIYQIAQLNLVMFGEEELSSKIYTVFCVSNFLLMRAVNTDIIYNWANDTKSKARATGPRVNQNQDLV